jgi:2-methylisocitrate lyase-like PEP mutase family enzyme
MSESSTNKQNDRARVFAALHKSGDPVLLANVYDPITANAISSIPGVKAIATASFAVAAAQGLKDEELTLAKNLAACALIAEVVAKKNLPLSLDLQDGYGEQLEDCIKGAIEIGAVGCNIEDSYNDDQGKCHLRDMDEQVARLVKAREYAAKYGVPDFVLNARLDAIRVVGDVNESIRRGKAYLQAGATTVFAWGNPGTGRGLSDAEITTFVSECNGRVSVAAKRGVNGLSTKQLGALGVARVSIGPQMMRIGMEAVRASAEVFEGQASLNEYDGQMVWLKVYYVPTSFIRYGRDKMTLETQIAKLKY